MGVRFLIRSRLRHSFVAMTYSSDDTAWPVSRLFDFKT